MAPTEQARVSRVVAVGAEDLYHWIADVIRMPDWSTETRRCTWLDGANAARPGAKFMMTSRKGLVWLRFVCEVVHAEPGKMFAYRTRPRRGRAGGTVSSFQFEPAPGGTRVTYSCARENVGERHEDRLPAMTRTLERIADLVEGRVRVQQPQLGQVYTAEGPIDLSAMFVMHHGFRRDLRDLVVAVPRTPLADAEVWAALDRRWRGMATALHHHHRVEDDALWPPLLERVEIVGDVTARETLKAMDAEHALLDPMVQACTDGFRAMVEAPDAAVRDRLTDDLADTREVLLQHLAHEEADAMPLVQRYLSVAGWADFEAAARKEYGLADIGFAVPWSILEIPTDQFEIAYAHGGGMVRAMLALTRRRFEREHRVAFRHLPGAVVADSDVGT
ncbi:SRPBCC family protein [Kribbella sp. CA-253562]|uniref:SRPBCC family protein n=1 Tax=Kribbella sp. CA-253562 TaxID=3239942 RepID=UPI003D91332E